MGLSLVLFCFVSGKGWEGAEWRDRNKDVWVSVTADFPGSLWTINSSVLRG